MSALGQWWISSPLQEVIQTSNPTESLHATVWRRALKSKHSGKKTAELAVALAVMQHNKVATALVDAVDSLGVSPGAEVVRVASLYETANSQPCHKAVSKTSRKMKALGKLQLGVWQEAKGGTLWVWSSLSCVPYSQRAFTSDLNLCKLYIFFHISTEYGLHTFIIYLPHVAGIKNSHNGDFTLVLLKIFDVHLVFCRFLKTYFSTILQFCGRSPVKSTKVRSLIFLPRIPYSTVSAMMLFKHDSFYTKIFIDDWSCYNIWKNVNNSSQLLFDNKFCKGLNKNSIIALNNTSVNHDKQKRRKQVLSFSARPPAKSCIPIFTEKPVAMVTIMQMRWNYRVGHLFPPDIHPESFIKIASLVVEISSESISRPVSYLNIINGEFVQLLDVRYTLIFYIICHQEIV